jgi:hypothetical protein
LRQGLAELFAPDPQLNYSHEMYPSSECALCLDFVDGRAEHRLNMVNIWFRFDGRSPVGSGQPPTSPTNPARWPGCRIGSFSGFSCGPGKTPRRHESDASNGTGQVPLILLNPLKRGSVERSSFSETLARVCS